MKTLVKAVLVCLLVIFAKSSLVDTVVESSNSIVEVLSALEGMDLWHCKKGFDPKAQSGMEGCEICEDGYYRYCDYKDMHHEYCWCIQN